MILSIPKGMGEAAGIIFFIFIVQRRIIRTIDEAASEIIEVSHRIHAQPELGYQELFASKLLIETLRRSGFQVEAGYVGIDTAFCARKGNPGGLRVAFPAEYDALPGIGHGCGDVGRRKRVHDNFMI